jgi:DNA-binding CsgD family transcriptional regulator
MKSENESIVFSGKNQNGNRNNTLHNEVISNKQTFFDEMPEINPQFIFSSCFVDHSHRQYACIYGNCTEHNGCCMNALLNEQPNFHVLHFHPGDRKLWCKEVYPDILRHIDIRTALELPNYMFSFNHRYVRIDGSISHFLHEGFVTFNNDKCLPVLNLTVFTEIGDIKTDDTIVLSIFRYLEYQGFEKIFTKMYSETHNSVLTHREIEIVRLCHQGLSSKMIADKLELSIHTVKNHKRKCMEKSMTHNITQLIHLCLKNNWL